jgi:hypothetical protein
MSPKKHIDDLRRKVNLESFRGESTSIPVRIVQFFPELNGVWCHRLNDPAKIPFKEPYSDNNAVFRLGYPPEVSISLGIIAGKTVGLLHTKGGAIGTGVVSLSYSKPSESINQYSLLRGEWAI